MANLKPGIVLDLISSKKGKQINVKEVKDIIAKCSKQGTDEVVVELSCKLTFPGKLFATDFDHDKEFPSDNGEMKLYTPFDDAGSKAIYKLLIDPYADINDPNPGVQPASIKLAFGDGPKTRWGM